MGGIDKVLPEAAIRYGTALEYTRNFPPPMGNRPFLNCKDDVLYLGYIRRRRDTCLPSQFVISILRE